MIDGIILDALDFWVVPERVEGLLVRQVGRDEGHLRIFIVLGDHVVIAQLGAEHGLLGHDLLPIDGFQVGGDHLVPELEESLDLEQPRVTIRAGHERLLCHA